MGKLSNEKWAKRSNVKLIKIPKGIGVLRVYGHPINSKETNK